MIKLKNVSFSYGEKEIIKDFSLEINRSDRICLFGESGCGKTTLLKLILKLINPDMGEVIFDGDLKPSVVFQEDRLLPYKSVLDNIIITGAEKEDALKLMDVLGIKETANKKPSDLSGGMRRRVAIARALAYDFDFLVLDEPFTGLDSENIKKTAEYINSILGDRPLILVTHSKGEAELLNAEIINL